MNEMGSLDVSFEPRKLRGRFSKCLWNTHSLVCRPLWALKMVEWRVYHLHGLQWLPGLLPEWF